jgi:uncharacterized protein (DUF433 family)
MKPLKLSVPLPEVLHEVDGDIRVKGHRISLYDIVRAHDNHWISPEGMVFYYPTLSYDEICKVFEFYRANQAAVDEYVAECKAREGAFLAMAKPVPMEEYRRRFEEMRKSSPDLNGVARPPAKQAEASETTAD